MRAQRAPPHMLLLCTACVAMWRNAFTRGQRYYSTYWIQLVCTLGFISATAADILFFYIDYEYICIWTIGKVRGPHQAVSLSNMFLIFQNSFGGQGGGLRRRWGRSLCVRRNSVLWTQVCKWEARQWYYYVFAAIANNRVRDKDSVWQHDLQFWKFWPWSACGILQILPLHVEGPPLQSTTEYSTQEPHITLFRSVARGFPFSCPP